MKNLPTPLAPLAKYKQFMLYKTEPRNDGSGKSNKYPCDIFGKRADAHDPKNWISAVDAIEMARYFREPYGVAFVFTENDPFFFLDIDNCALPDGSDWNATANLMIGMFPGAAVEKSTSGKGLHIFGSYTNVPEHSMRNAGINCEFYTSKRFVALTGKCGESGSADQDCTALLPNFISTYFPPKAHSVTDWTTEPVPEYTPFKSDEELLMKALKSKSVEARLGQGASFEDLWTNNIAVLASKYPNHDGGDGTDGSQVDAALAQHLAFWTGKNCEHMERLMLESDLKRDKWDHHKAYLPMTIKGAVGKQETVYTGGKAPKPPTESVKVEDIVRPGASLSREAQVMDTYQFMGIAEQLEYFKGCVYVTSLNSIINGNGRPLKQEQFNNWYGGYEFAMDNQQNKTTRKAWEAFTQSLGVKHPKADTTCFRPELPEHHIFEEDGSVLMNIFKPMYGKSKEGNVDIFLEHTRKLIPDDKDREIFLSYLAACVQKAGVKFQWCVVLQGTQGNGKTLFFKILKYAVGERYVHIPNPRDLTNKFNAWIENKLLICIEEVHTQGRLDVADSLKPLITNDKIEIQSKGVDQRVGDNRANFIMFSNHKDAVHKTKDDRRYCVFYTEQQERGDLISSGMDAKYFSNLYNWLENEQGYEKVTHYLANRPINVDVLAVAPITTSTAESIESSMGMAEQLILNAIDLGISGMNNGVLLVEAARKYLFDNGKYLTPNKVANVLKSIGYIKHPNFHDGKASVHGSRQRVYVDPNNLEACALHDSKSLELYLAPAPPQHALSSGC